MVGTRRPHLVRYEIPVSVGVEGPRGERYGAFLDGFLAVNGGMYM